MFLSITRRIQTARFRWVRKGISNRDSLMGLLSSIKRSFWVMDRAKTIRLLTKISICLKMKTTMKVLASQTSDKTKFKRTNK